MTRAAPRAAPSWPPRSPPRRVPPRARRSRRRRRSPPRPRPPHGPDAAARRRSASWTTTPGPRTPTGARGTAEGTARRRRRPPRLASRTPAGTADYTDPHTGKTATWEYATWTSPVAPARGPRDRGHRLLERAHPGRHLDPDRAAGHLLRRQPHPLVRDGPLGRRRRQDIRRTSVDDQSDGKSSIWTDTFAIDDPASGLRLASYQLRLTLYRKPGTTPHAHRVAAGRDGLRRPRPLRGPGLRRPASPAAS